MRRTRPHAANENDMVVSRVSEPDGDQGRRKKRKTIMQALESLTMKTAQASNRETGTWMAARGDDTIYDDDSSIEESELPSDREKETKAAVYQLVWGRQRSNVVDNRVEQLIRQSRLRAGQSTQDDLHLDSSRDDDRMDEGDAVATRSNSLPPGMFGAMHTESEDEEMSS